VSPLNGRDRGILGRCRLLLHTAWLGRLILAVVGPVCIFYISEGLLRVVGFGVPTDLFIADSELNVFRTNREFTTPFIPKEFGVHPVSFRLTKHKEEGAFRIFVLGESAALGDPSPSFGVAAQLEAQLETHFPGRKIEVYNMGIVAINSHVVYQMVREIAQFEPDLLVIYMGNNEVIGPYGPGCYYLSSMPPLAVIRASFWVRSTRLGQLFTFVLEHISSKKRDSHDWRGLEQFRESNVRGDDRRLNVVYDYFAANLRDSIKCVAGSHTKIIMATVVGNYSFAPFLSVHRSDFPTSELRGFDAAFGEGVLAWQLEDRDKALSAFWKVLSMDREFADSYYMLGRIEEELGSRDLARRHFIDALHWDALRLRPDAPINEIIRKVANENNGTVFLVDAAKEMGGDMASTVEPAGRELLFDHVHFKWKGNYQLGKSLAQSCAEALSSRSDAKETWLNATQCAEALGCTEFETMMTAVRVYQRLISREPFASQMSYGEELTRLGIDIKLANDHIEAAGGVPAEEQREEQVLQRSPKNADFVSRRVILDSDLGQFNQALQLIDEYRRLVPESPYIFVTQKAAILQRLNRYDDAEALLTESIRTDPGYFQAGDALVGVWSKTGQFVKGRALLGQLLNVSPGNSHLRLDLATLHLLSGDVLAAASEAVAVFRRDPGNEEALELSVRCYQLLGKDEVASGLMQEARKAQPYNIENYRRLVQVAIKQGDRDGTVDLLKSMEESNPVDAAFHVDLARRYLELNRRSEMIGELGKARQLARIEKATGLIETIDSLLQTYKLQ
jgi:tetratricopeptide (TPR) repeat protein